MAAPDPAPRALLWAQPDQGGWLSTAIRNAGLVVGGVGCPDSGRGPELVEKLGAARETVLVLDDLRAALTTADVDVIIIASAGDFAGGARQGAMDREDATALAACRARGVRIATIEPMPCSALQLGLTVEPVAVAAVEREAETELLSGPAGAGLSLGPGAPVRTETEAKVRQPIDAGGGWARMLPVFRLGQPMREAVEVLEQFGHIRAVAFEGWCAASQGSLGARLFDALDCVISILGGPEQIDANFIWPARGRTLHHDAGDNLRGLSGDLTANLRFSDGRSASIGLSNHAGRWGRTLSLIGEGGRLVVSDERRGGRRSGFEWIGIDGHVIDTSVRETAGSIVLSSDDSFAESVADQLARMVDPRIAAPSPTDYAAVLAAAGATLLSARTGEAESTQTILRMINR